MDHIQGAGDLVVGAGQLGQVHRVELVRAHSKGLRQFGGIGLADEPVLHDAAGGSDDDSRQKDPQQELRDGDQGDADDLAEHEFGGLDGRHKDFDHAALLLLDYGGHHHAAEHRHEHEDDDTQYHGNDGIDIRVRNFLLARLRDSVRTELDIGLDILHDLVQALYAIGGDTIVLDGLVQTVGDVLRHIHSQGLGGIEVRMDSLALYVEPGDVEQAVIAKVGHMELDRIWVLAVAVDVFDGLGILEIRHDYSGAVDDSDGLGLLLGGEHDRHDADGQAGHENGNEQCGDEEALLLHLVEVLAPDDDSYVV